MSWWNGWGISGIDCQMFKKAVILSGLLLSVYLETLKVNLTEEEIEEENENA